MTAPFTDRTGATDEEFQARVAVFDAAEEPEEVVVERVARAILYAEVAEAGYIDGAAEAWLNAGEDQDYYRRLALAALAALRGDRGE